VAATYVAGGSIGSLLPLSLQGVTALDASLALMLPELIAKLAGALKAQLSLSISPPALAGSLEVALKAVINLQIAISGPSISLDFSAIAALMAEIQAALGALSLNLALSIGLKLTFGHAGLHLIKLEGRVGDFGTDLQSIVASGLPGGSPEDEGFALVLAAGADPATIAVLKLLAGIS
jgi:hypothetical protein